MGIAASAAWRCINGHFIAINFSRAGQASLGFWLLTFTFLSLIISGSGQDEQWIPPLQQYLFVTSYAVGQLVVRNSQTKLLCFIGKTWTKAHIGLTFFVLWFFNLSFVNGGLWLKSKQQDTTTILLKPWQLNWCHDIAVTSKQTYFG